MIAISTAALATVLCLAAAPDEPTLKIDAARVVNRITPWMYGSCIEDVNHEIYGGLYAQMIFGESFEEPPPRPPAAGWKAFGGRWETSADGILSAEANYGAKAVADAPEVADGEVSAEVRFRDDAGENGGLLVRVRDPRVGADAWAGYEVSLSPKQHLMVGRHDNNFRLLKRIPFRVEPGRWHRLGVELAGPTIRVRVDDAPEPALVVDDPAPLPGGRIGVRTWGSNVDFRNTSIRKAGPPSPIAIGPPPGAESDLEVSAMWDIVRTGDAAGRVAWDADRPFNSARSQKIEMTSGTGTVGVANRGLNRWGLAVREGRAYAGRAYLRAGEFRGKVTAALQSADGSKTYATRVLEKAGADWKRREFSLTSSATDPNARFALWVDGPGPVWVDQVYLSGTGDDLFRGLPYRGDIARALKAQGLTLLRYGGSMVNNPGYRWKAQVGDRDRRAQYPGTWYPWSTNGFGIGDFVRFCREAGFEPVVTINIEELPADAADLVDYLNAPASTPWGRRRAEDGHPEPFAVRFIEIGNEETVNAHYIERFRVLYDAMRPRDPRVDYIIGSWWEPDNPVSKDIVRTLDGKAALWDVHVGGDDPREGAKVDATFARMRKLVAEWAPGTTLKACILEENGGHHDMARALGHAGIVNASQRHGDFVLIDCPANALQALGQNDNGWDQGQLFYTPSRVWGMPPYHAQVMASSAHQPCRVASEVIGPPADLDLTATRDEAGTALVLKVVHAGDQPVRATVDLAGFGPVDPGAAVATLSGALAGRNTPDHPDRIRPVASEFIGASGHFSYEFPPRSYTVMTLTRRR